ncbi:MAG: rhodanese-like domain-containing protein [bacterium]
MMKFIDAIRDLLGDVPELMPWDVEEKLAEEEANVLVIDVREADEFATMHIPGSINIPRGILESACEWDFEETEPELVKCRDSGREVAVVCRSGHRSILSAWSLLKLGYPNVFSLKTGLRGWNDFEQPLVNASGESVDMDFADEFFTAKLREDQRKPA